MLCLGWDCGVVVEFVVDVGVVVPVVAPSGRGDAVASPRPSVADPRPRWGPTNASAWRPATVRMNNGIRSPVLKIFLDQSEQSSVMSPLVMRSPCDVSLRASGILCLVGSACIKYAAVVL